MARGDHIYVYSLAYSHHGIDIGDGRVVHYDSGPWQKLYASPDKPAAIRVTAIEQFAMGREVFVRRYEVCDGVERVVERALSRIGEQGYQLFENNCEHFSVWCKTGHSESTQVESAQEAAKPLSKGIATAAVLMRSARHLPSRARPLAYGAALAVTAGAFAARYFENRLRNYVRGES